MPLFSFRFRKFCPFFQTDPMPGDFGFSHMSCNKTASLSELVISDTIACIYDNKLAAHGQ